MLMTRDRWASLVGSFDSSGLTVAEYCDRRGVSPASFHRWRRLLREAPAHRARPAFVEAIVRPAGSAPAVEVSRWRVVVPRGFDEETLARLVLALERIGSEAAESAAAAGDGETRP